MNNESSDNLNTILAGALILIAVFIFTAMIMVRSQASHNSTSTTLSVNNVPPVVTNVTVSQYQNSNTVTLGGDSGLIVNPGSTTLITVSGIISDDNGEEDIAEYDVFLGRLGNVTACEASLDGVSTRTNLNQGANYNYCYFNTTLTSEGGTCTLDAVGTGNVLERNLTCDLYVNYNADSTDGKRSGGSAAFGAQFGEDFWEVFIVAEDLNGEVSNTTYGTSNFSQFDVDPQVSLTIPGSIDYGAVEVGGISSAHTMTHVQQANQIGDTQVYAYNQMDCQANVSTASPPVGDGSTGSIPFSNQRWALTAAAAIDPANSTQFSNTSTHTNVDVGYAQSSNDNANITGGTGTVAFAMHNLPTGIRGFCYGDVTITHSPVN